MKSRVSIGIRLFGVLNAMIMTIVVIATLYPILYVISASLSDQMFIEQGRVGIIPLGLNFKAYSRVFAYPFIGRSYLNTLLYTASSVVLSLTLTVCAAYPLSRQRFLGKKLFMGVIVFAMLFNAGIIPTFLVVKNAGLYNSIWALIVPGAISSFYVVILRTFFQQIPKEIDEAAQIDGCNSIQSLLRIILPMSLPGLTTIGLFYAVNQWNSFFPAMIYLRDRSKFPIQLILRQIVILNETDSLMQGVMEGRDVIGESIKYATIVVATLPIMMVYPFIQKYFVKGAMVGSVKG